jgi:hypothetical protein
MAETSLFKLVQTISVGKLVLNKFDDDIRRLTRYVESCNLMEDSGLENDTQSVMGTTIRSQLQLLFQHPYAKAKVDQCVSSYDS